MLAALRSDSIEDGVCGRRSHRRHFLRGGLADGRQRRRVTLKCHPSGLGPGELCLQRMEPAPSGLKSVNKSDKIITTADSRADIIKKIKYFLVTTAVTSEGPYRKSNGCRVICVAADTGPTPPDGGSR